MAEPLPLLLRAARGEQVERPPVVDDAPGRRYMKVYRELRDRHPGFASALKTPISPTRSRCNRSGLLRPMG